MAGALSDKVALVTGGGTGIGKGAALGLAEAGATVVITGRRKARLDEVVAQIEAAGGTAVALTGDVSQEADAFKAVADTVAQFGRIDILVNSAGINEAGGVESLSLDLWRKVMEINFNGTLYTCKAALPHMKAQGAGDIINISSTSGRRAAGLFGSYSASKFAVNGFTEALRQEVGLAGIRVCVIEPGATESEIADSVSDPQWAEMMKAHVSKEGAMKAEDIADAVLFAVTLPRRANVCEILIRPTIDVTPM